MLWTENNLSTFCILYFRSFHNKITANGKVTQRTPWNFKSFHNDSEANCLYHIYRALQKNYACGISFEQTRMVLGQVRPVGHLTVLSGPKLRRVVQISGSTGPIES